MFKVIIRETGDKDVLSLIDAKTGLDYVQDFIGNVGALSDGQFTYDSEQDTYLVSQDDYDWWSNTITLHQQLNDRIAELSEDHGSEAVYKALEGIDYVDLDAEAKAMLKELDEVFGDPSGN